MRKLTVLLCLLSVLGGCVARGQNPEIILEDTTCSVPCWFGLKPGISTLAQSQTILQSLEFVSQPPRAQPSSISWSFTGPATGHGVLTFKDSVLRQINLEVSALNLGVVIDKLGPPEQVFPSYQPADGAARYALTLYYPTRGIVVETYDAPRGNLRRGKEDIERDLTVMRIGMFVPTDLKDVLNTEEYGSQERINYILQYLQPWPGFGKDVVRIKPLN